MVTNDQGEAGYHDVIECVESLAKVCILLFLSLHVNLILLIVHVKIVCAYSSLQIFIITATENEARWSVSWIHWCNWSKNKEGKCRDCLYWVYIPSARVLCDIAFRDIHYAFTKFLTSHFISIPTSWNSIVFNVTCFSFHLQGALLNSLPILVNSLSSSVEG